MKNYVVIAGAEFLSKAEADAGRGAGNERITWAGLVPVGGKSGRKEVGGEERC